MTARTPQTLGLDGEAAPVVSDASASLLARQLLRAVEEASPAELPALVGALAQAQAVALARLVTPLANGSEGPRLTDGLDDTLLTYEAAARLVHCSESYIETLGAQGKLPTVRLPATDKAGRTRGGRLVRIRTGDLREWIDRHRT